MAGADSRSAPRPLEDYRAEFASLQRGDLHFTHCAVSVLPRRAVSAMREYLATRSVGIVSYADVQGPLEQARAGLATLLGASPDEIAFTSSTAEGANLVANGLAFREGDNIVSADIEFPDNVYPWSYLERRGVEIRRVASRDGRVPVEDLAAAMDDRTRLAAVSFVQFVSGHRLDVAQLAEICRRRDVRFFLDAMQGLGALRLDLSRIPVDFVAAGGYKWLLGPMGTGLLYCRRERLEELEVSSIGSGSMVDPKRYFPYRHELRPEAARFEGAATKNFLGLFGLGASVGLLLEAGPERIEERVLELTASLAERLRRAGYRLRSPVESDQERSGILCFEHPRIATEEIVAELAERRIFVTTAEGRVRVAPHFYHCEDDLGRLLEALPAVEGGRG